MDLFIWGLLLFAFLVASTVKRIDQGQCGLRMRLGKYIGMSDAGIVFLIPGIEQLKVVDMREQVLNVPEQQIITRDNVPVTVDAVVYVQITDAPRAMFEINNVFLAVINLAQTTLRSALGTMTLDDTLSNRGMINSTLLETLDKETMKWGIKVMRVEIKKLDPPKDIQDAMSKQMKAEREKRAQILEAEGYKQSLITKSEGDKQSQILQAEGEKEARILRAVGEAEAMVTMANSKAKQIELESNASQQFFVGQAVTKEQLRVAESALGNNTKYVLPSELLENLSSLFTKK